MPTVLEKLMSFLSSKLNNAETVTLIVDIWTNKINADFIALAACYTDKNFFKQIHVIGMMRMPGSHCAENIKQGIEEIVNKYDFDKSKIDCNYFSYHK